MPRLKFIGEPTQGIPGGPIWEPGEERDLSDQEAAPYLRNVNWQEVPTIVVDAPAPPAEGSST